MARAVIFTAPDQLKYNNPKTLHHKLLLITNYRESNPRGGREMLCALNLTCLNEIFNDKLYVLHLQIVKQKGLLGVFKYLSGFIDGVTDEASSKAIALIRQECVTSVFIDGSNLGTIAMHIKIACPTVRVTTFCHNVEARFFLGSFRLHPSLRSAVILFANYIAERRSVDWSEQIICLNRRDSLGLSRLYGRRATHVSALAIKNRFPGEFRNPSELSNPYALFVGGAFYGNLHGIRWYAKNVSAFAPIKTFVVGKGFDAYRNELEACGNLIVIGEADELSAWYLNALLIVAPIFEGSGMKTKVAEALMYGKKVIGSEEAFMGYEDALPDAGWICRDSAEFIAAIGYASTALTRDSDPALRAIYQAHYSQDAARARLHEILCDTPQLRSSLQ